MFLYAYILITIQHCFVIQRMLLLESHSIADFPFSILIFLLFIINFSNLFINTNNMKNENLLDNLTNYSIINNL